jgi:UDP-2,3-diacylglucosamine pyrophosphatase LpxH
VGSVYLSFHHFFMREMEDNKEEKSREPSHWLCIGHIHRINAKVVPVNAKSPWEEDSSGSKNIAVFHSHRHSEYLGLLRVGM